jgi:hypothetical protein
MLAVVPDVKEGGRDLIPGSTLKEHAGTASSAGDVDGLMRHDEACVTDSGHRVKTTLERDSEGLWNRSASTSCRFTWRLHGE